MKPLIFSFGLVLLFLSGCQILGTDGPDAPKVSVDPAPVFVEEQLSITIRSAMPFYMPSCGSITYSIERQEAEGWATYERHGYMCTAIFDYKSRIEQFVILSSQISEAGTYRIKSAYKFKEAEEMQPLYSAPFEVKNYDYGPH
jgi:hypothetical protein